MTPRLCPAMVRTVSPQRVKTSLSKILLCIDTRKITEKLLYYKKILCSNQRFFLIFYQKGTSSQSPFSSPVKGTVQLMVCSRVKPLLNLHAQENVFIVGAFDPKTAKTQFDPTCKRLLRVLTSGGMFKYLLFGAFEAGKQR